LALTVDRFVEDPPVRTIAVLSAEVGDGRSLTAELLAVALSELRPPVRLLDADPFQRGRVRRRNRLRRLVGSRNRLEPWYSSFSGQEGALDEPAGNGDLPPFARIPLAREIFPSLSTFLHDVRAALDTEVAMGALVLIDVPACSVSSIGFAVARMADAAIYVARPGRADLEAHHKVVAQAELLNLNVLGVVFNEG
jgi:Mrp family chromosome partitioning ATPase